MRFGVLGLWIAIGAGCAIDTLDSDELGTNEQALNGNIANLGGVRERATVHAGICTGVAINANTVLTAAHCVCIWQGCETCASHPYKFCKAEMDIGTVSNPNPPFKGIAQMHPDYDALNKNDPYLDLAVVYSPTPLTNDANVLFAQPQASWAPYVGQGVYLVGFGRFDAEWGSGDCALQDGGANLRYGLTGVTEWRPSDSHGPTIRTEDNIHTCVGDSGGPVYTDTNTVIGINARQDDRISDAAALYTQQGWVSAVQNLPASIRTRIMDFAHQEPPAAQVYQDSNDGIMVGWLDLNYDTQLVGDFRQFGWDQILMLNRGPIGSGRVFIGDWRDGFGPTDNRYYESYGQSGLLVGWMDSEDFQLAGNFRGYGRDLVMFLNRNTADAPYGRGRVMIADFASGSYPAVPRYWENYPGGSCPVCGLLNGWMDTDGDLAVAGDFRDLGYDQVMFINRSPGAASSGQGRILIADFYDGVAPAEIRYWESYGQFSTLNGLTDASDIVLVGDFKGLGYDQVLFINQDGNSSTHALIADFKDGVGPVEVRYNELYGQSGMLVGWHDAGDVQLVGNFVTSRDQVMFLNTSNPQGGIGRVQIVDFGYSATPPASVLFYESTSTYDPWLGGMSNPNIPCIVCAGNSSNYVFKAGNFRGRGRSQLFTAKRN